MCSCHSCGRLLENDYDPCFTFSTANCVNLTMGFPRRSVLLLPCFPLCATFEQMDKVRFEFHVKWGLLLTYANEIKFTRQLNFRRPDSGCIYMSIISQMNRRTDGLTEGHANTALPLCLDFYALHAKNAQKWRRRKVWADGLFPFSWQRILIMSICF